MHNTNLNFFGTEMVVFSDNEILIDRINFIFRYFLSDCTSPQIFFKVSTRKKTIGNPLLLDDGLLTNRTAVISYSYDNKKYYSWDYNDTFLPPLQIYPLAGRFLVLHGCAIMIKGRTIVFVSPSFGGKTTMVYYALKQGASCITDDLVFIENGNVIPYKKPVGIRETNHVAITDFNVRKDVHPLTLINPQGLATHLVHLDDLFNVPYVEDPSSIDWFVIPDKNKTGKPRKLDMFEVTRHLSASICNSGLDDRALLESLFFATSSAKGAFFLPTGDIENAFNNMMSII